MVQAFTGEAIDAATLQSLLDAAHDAPAGVGTPPWRFLCAPRDTADWARLLRLLPAREQAWARQASALLLTLSDSLLHGGPGEQPRPNPTHAIDAGVAWAALALQARRSGWQVQAVARFDRDGARRAFAIPSHVQLHALSALGRPALAAGGRLAFEG